MQLRHSILCLVSAWMLVGIQSAFAAPGLFEIDNMYFNQTSGTQPVSAASWQLFPRVLSMQKRMMSMRRN